ncbi:hypothetical protein H4582DRAFT_1987975 [Lactarius indigo]|nr:hypothetical protein H4582DRAFT_1987975 [Lactarius indigo]
MCLLRGGPQEQPRGNRWTRYLVPSPRVFVSHFISNALPSISRTIPPLSLSRPARVFIGSASPSTVFPLELLPLAYLTLPKNVTMPYLVTTQPTAPSASCNPPSSYAPGSISSLVISFEDPSWDTLQALLAQLTLYAFGNAGTSGAESRSLVPRLLCALRPTPGHPPFLTPIPRPDVSSPSPRRLPSGGLESPFPRVQLHFTCTTLVRDMAQLLVPTTLLVCMGPMRCFRRCPKRCLPGTVSGLVPAQVEVKYINLFIRCGHSKSRSILMSSMRTS